MSKPDPDRSLEVLLQAHLTRLRGYLNLRAHGCIRRNEPIADLVQSVCREVLEQRDRVSFATSGEFRSWLFGIATGKLVDRGRRRSARKRDPRGVVDPLCESAVPAKDHSPSTHACRNEDATRLTRAMARLSDEDFRIVSLARFQHLSHVEIAATLGKSEVAVRKMFSRAMAQLALRLRQCAP